MLVIKKQDVTITKMTYEETGILPPCGGIVLAPIMGKGYSVRDARAIKALMDYHQMSLEDAIKKHEDNLAWVNEK